MVRLANKGNCAKLLSLETSSDRKYPWKCSSRCQHSCRRRPGKSKYSQLRPLSPIAELKIRCWTTYLGDGARLLSEAV